MSTFDHAGGSSGEGENTNDGDPQSGAEPFGFSSASTDGASFVTRTELHALQIAQSAGFENKMMQQEREFETSIEEFRSVADELKSQMRFTKWQTFATIIGAAVASVLTLIGLVYANKEFTESAFLSGYGAKETIQADIHEYDSDLSATRSLSEQNTKNIQNLESLVKTIAETQIEANRRRKGIGLD